MANLLSCSRLGTQLSVSGSSAFSPVQRQAGSPLIPVFNRRADGGRAEILPAAGAAAASRSPSLQLGPIGPRQTTLALERLSGNSPGHTSGVLHLPSSNSKLHLHWRTSCGAPGAAERFESAADGGNGSTDEDDFAFPPQLLEHSAGAQFTAVDPKHRRNLLMFAAMGGHIKTLRLLLAHSPDVQVAAADRQGRNALMLAVLGDHPDCLPVLLEHSPDVQVHAKDSCGYSALIWSCGNRSAACMQLLLQHSPEEQVAAAVAVSGFTALMFAAGCRHAEHVQLLLRHSPDAQVATVDARGANALMQAACGGHADFVRLLLQHSPDAQVAAASQSGIDTLEIAALQGHVDCLRLMLPHSSEAQRSATVGPLVSAAREGHVECVELLLAYSPSAQQLEGALYIAEKRLSELYVQGAEPLPEEDEQLVHAIQACAELLMAKLAETMQHNKQKQGIRE